jgi:hypothetical protein
MPLNSAGCLGRQTSHTRQSLDVILGAAPLYGEHIVDQLDEAVDQSGLVTEAYCPRINISCYNKLQHDPFETEEFFSETIGSTSAGTQHSIIYNHKLGKLRLKITRFAQRYMLMILADIRPRKTEAAIDL